MATVLQEKKKLAMTRKKHNIGGTFELQAKLTSKLKEMDNNNVVMPHSPFFSPFSLNAEIMAGKTEQQLTRVQCRDGSQRPLTNMLHGNYLGFCHSSITHFIGDLQICEAFITWQV